jgi:hypothetical protein
VTVAVAAQRLGITKEAVRKRIHRGTLRSDKDEDGTVHVYIPPSGTTSSTDRDLLYQQMQSRITYLEAQVEAEREARRRADTIIAQLSQANAALAARVPELEAAQPSEDASEDAAEEQAIPAQGQGDASAHAPSSQQRPWWRRMFGG